MDRNRFLAAAAVVDRAADAVGSPRELDEQMKALRYMEEIQIAMTNERINRGAATRARQKELLPLRDEGDDFGRVEARIPEDLFFGLMHQRNFGLDGFTSDEGMRDFGKSFPQYICRTVSGKITVGYGGRRTSARRRVNLARANFNGLKPAN